jgi:hypothetical protein
MWRGECSLRLVLRMRGQGHCSSRERQPRIAQRMDRKVRMRKTWAVLARCCTRHWAQCIAAGRGRKVPEGRGHLVRGMRGGTPRTSQDCKWAALMSQEVNMWRRMMRTELAVQTSVRRTRGEGRTKRKMPKSQWLVDTPRWFVNSSVDTTDWLWLDRLGFDRRRKTAGDTGLGHKNLRRNMAGVVYIRKILLLGRTGSLAV